MERIRITDDGFTTLYSSEFGQFYHSVRGAMAETQLVYIELGLLAKAQKIKQINVLEVGFGTGLNALVSVLEAQKHDLKIHYTTLEPFPISDGDVQLLNYQDKLHAQISKKLHEAKWEEEIEINPNFYLTKIKTSLQDFSSKRLFDVVYYDAFAPSSQPELWTEETFSKVALVMQKGGFLTTYCSKTVVRKAMQAAGFIVEKHQGMWGKREVVRAING
jgi:tRNA U34 5-methylaminomethyl-2-thiouridine-forming methyltransferase MnmC